MKQPTCYTLIKNLVFLLFMSIVTSTYANADTEDLRTRPDPAGTVTQIKTAVIVLDVSSVNGVSQTFTANVALIAEWKDQRLAGQSDRSSVGLNTIWNPQLQILNQQRVLKTLPDIAEIDPDGTVRIIQRYWGMFSNPLDLRDFPLDQHDFNIQFIATAGDVNAIHMINADEEQMRSGLAEKVSLPDWDVVDWNVSNDPVELIAGMVEVPGFRFSFKARRHVGYYLIKVLIPLIMIVMMSWIVFWIHPTETGSQISVSVTSMLTLIAYRFAIGTSLPTVSYLTRMDFFILFSTIMVFIALLETVWTSRLVKNERVEVAVSFDRACRVIFPVLFTIVFLYTVIM